MQLKKVLSILGLSLALSGYAYAVDSDFWLNIQNDKAPAITRYLAQGVDPNSKSLEELPAVMWAIQNQSWKVYELLVAHRQFDPNQTNAHDETPLMYLALVGEDQRARELIQKGAQVQRLGWTPLHYAAAQNHLSTAQLLLDQGALVNAPAPDGTTPLMMAARSGSSRMVDALLEQGADPTVLNLKQQSAADWAEANKQTRLALQLREIATRYAQDRQANQGQVQPVYTHELGASTATQNQENNATDSTSGSAGSSQYFDLKRFD